MSTHSHIDKICCAIISVALVITVLLMSFAKTGLTAVGGMVMGYEDRIFDTSRVHSVNIVMDDVEQFFAGAEKEEYTLCTVIIDGEKVSGAAIRAKGNTSLSQVKAYNNNRYSFKLEFDHYSTEKTYHGLDKLCLNNIIQDNTYMKDYLTYRMMNYAGVASPLCSYAEICFNGESFGLYLAVEGIEESFLTRNYGTEYGDLYKPDSISAGGGRGNGKDFDMEAFNEKTEKENGEADSTQATEAQLSEPPQMPENMPQTPEGMPQMPEGMPQNGDGQNMMPLGGFSPGGESSVPQPPDMNEGAQGEKYFPEKPADNRDNTESGASGKAEIPKGDDNFPEKGGSSQSVALVYSDDSEDSYSDIFESAKTDISSEDKKRLISSIKQLNENNNISEVVDIDSVIKYFAIHNLVLNFDSYTGSMMHNYYLYEKDGVMSMIPWDYNLAFGGFGGASSAQELINYPIDTPVSGATVSSRPMLSWIFSDEKYTKKYHEYLNNFISEFFGSGEFEKMIDETTGLISPYVEKDATKFCTYDEFVRGAETLKSFCLLRSQSVKKQLSGEIPSTGDKQKESSISFASDCGINISDMGSMGGSFGEKGGRITVPPNKK